MSDEILYQIQNSLGRIEQKIDSHIDNFRKHEEEDRAARAELDKLRLGSARQKGFITALTTVGSVLGAGIGYLIERVTIGHH